ncbi:hypothetical protein HDV00_011917 [Rhizophlyctis rosea]|nr:hypothetical protein HDV00_011917 [Rhizophlyctis rosea]
MLQLQPQIPEARRADPGGKAAIRKALVDSIEIRIIAVTVENIYNHYMDDSTQEARDLQPMLCLLLRAALVHKLGIRPSPARRKRFFQTDVTSDEARYVHKCGDQAGKEVRECLE